MNAFNSDQRYGLVAISLHWLMAVLIIGLIALGLYMVDLPISLNKLKYYGWHKSFGLLVLMLAIIRLIWRLINTTPELSLPLFEMRAARSVHIVFYILMFLMPMTGWLMTSAAGLSASFFGWFLLPDLVSTNEVNQMLFEQLHHWLGYTLIAAILLHFLAAIKHHFINKDDILKRILP